LRTSVQLGVAGLNLLLNLWLIPLWGWKGAAVASWVSDGLLAVVLWGCVLVLSTKSQMPKRGVP